jgi:CRP-like cAMP-binding protein
MQHTTQSDFPQALQELLARTKPRDFASGATLIDASDTAPPVWYIESGLVRLYALDADGDSYNLGFHADGELVSGRLALGGDEVCCIDRALGVEALQPTRARALALAELDRLRRSDPEVANWFIERLLQLNAERLGREADLVQRSAAERYAELRRKQAGIIERVPLQQIAAWLGITPVALSRIRRRMREQTDSPHGQG